MPDISNRRKLLLSHALKKKKKIKGSINLFQRKTGTGISL